jgi:type I restriction enzyme, S subunit
MKSSFDPSQASVWPLQTLSSLITEMRGGAPLKPSDFTKSGVKVVPKGGVGRKGWLEVTDQDLQYCSEEFANTHRTNQVNDEFTLVVLRDLVPAGPSIGLIVRMGDPDGWVLAQGVYGFKLNGKADPSFLSQVSNTQWYRRIMNQIMVGSTQVHITNTAFKSVVIPMPEIEEQRAISAALSDVDALIAGLEKLIAKKRDLKQAAMQQLLTGQTRLPGFSGDWSVINLGHVATFLKGKGLPKSALTSDGVDSCIHYGELFTHYAETVSEITSRTNGTRDSLRSVANDVLMPTSDVTPRGLAKASCVTLDNVILGGDILVIRSDPSRVFGAFLSYVIRREEDQVLRLVTGSTVYHLYGSDMKKFKFALPSVSEQIAISSLLSDMDAELTTLESRLAKTRDLKQGMMQELLTGRTRLV